MICNAQPGSDRNGSNVNSGMDEQSYGDRAVSGTNWIACRKIQRRLDGLRAILPHSKDVVGCCADRCDNSVQCCHSSFKPKSDHLISDK